MPTGAGESDPSVDEIALAFLRHAESYYRKGGHGTGEVLNVKLSIRALRKLYGETSARDFGPLALKAVRQEIIDSGLCRNECNRRASMPASWSAASGGRWRMSLSLRPFITG